MEGIETKINERHAKSSSVDLAFRRHEKKTAPAQNQTLGIWMHPITTCTCNEAHQWNIDLEFHLLEPKFQECRAARQVLARNHIWQTNQPTDKPWPTDKSTKHDATCLSKRKSSIKLLSSFSHVLPKHRLQVASGQRLQPPNVEGQTGQASICSNIAATMSSFTTLDLWLLRAFSHCDDTNLNRNVIKNEHQKKVPLLVASITTLAASLNPGTFTSKAAGPIVSSRSFSFQADNMHAKGMPRGHGAWQALWPNRSCPRKTSLLLWQLSTLHVARFKSKKVRGALHGQNR